MIFISNFAGQQRMKRRSSETSNRSVIASSEIDDQTWKFQLCDDVLSFCKAELQFKFKN
jgi:hypothetical protein